MAQEVHVGRELRAVAHPRSGLVDRPQACIPARRAGNDQQRCEQARTQRC
jgi:hypothetical protein